MDNKDNNDSRPSKGVLIGGVVALIAVIVCVVLFMPKKKSSSSSRRDTEMINIPLPPVLPPPPPPPPTPEEKLEQKEEVVINDVNDAPEAPSDDSAKGFEGKGDGFGLKGSKNGKGFGTGGAWSLYSRQLQSAIQDALVKHPATRNAQLKIELKVWPDLNGLITRVELQGSTGNPKVDDALKTQVLSGLQLPPPPPDMPTPVILRVTGRAPS